MSRTLKMFSDGSHHPDVVVTDRNTWDIDKDSYNFIETYEKHGYFAETVSREAELCPCVSVG